MKNKIIVVLAAIALLLGNSVQTHAELRGGRGSDLRGGHGGEIRGGHGGEIRGGHGGEIRGGHGGELRGGHGGGPGGEIGSEHLGGGHRGGEFGGEHHGGHRGEFGHGHGGVDLWFGPGWGPWGPYPYPNIYPYYVEPQPLEEGQYWYYCTNPEGYYPDVSQCSNGWMRVVPSPPE